MYNVSIASNAYLLDIGKGLFNPGLTKGCVAAFALASIAFVAESNAIDRDWETLYKQFPDLPTELDNEFNRLQAQTSEADPLAKDIYLKSQEEMDSLGTMNAVDQYLDKRYRDKGLVVPQIFGTQQQEPTSIQPSSFEEVPAVVTEPATASVAKVETQPKLNQQSRLALAGNDPLLQAIATETI